MGRIRAEHWLIAAAALALVTGTLLIVRPTGGMRDAADRLQGSSFYTSPSGTKAYYLLLRKLGIPVARLERRMSLARPNVGLLVVAGIKKPLADDEKVWLRSWVARGGALLWLPRRADGKPVGDDISELFGWDIDADAGEKLVETQATLGPLGGSNRTYAIEVNRGWRLRPTTDRPYELLAGTQDQPSAIVQTVERGSFIALADPGLVSNARLGQASHAVFMVHLAALAAGDKLALFDEYHHGFEGGVSFWSVAFDTAARWTILQGMVLLLLLAFVAGRRLGPPIEIQRHRRRRPAEFIEALANYCRRRNARQLAFEILYEQFKRECISHTADMDATGLARATRQDVRHTARLLEYAKCPPADSKTLVKMAMNLERQRRAISRRKS
jgi:hypothetical protein